MTNRIFPTSPFEIQPSTLLCLWFLAKNKNAGDKFSDMKSFEGPLHSIFEEAYTFIVRNTLSVSRFIKGNPKRQDSPLYPEEAIREALINALAHRDYSAASGGVSIHIHPRRLEIWNSGSLPDGVTAESLAKGHISVLRNPDIAHALYLRGLMEKAGRGSVLMVQRCRDAGLRDPFWKSDPKLGVTVTFPAPEVPPEVGGAESVTAPVTAPVGIYLAKLLLLLGQQEPLGNEEIRLAFSLKSRRRLRDTYLNPALAAGLIERTLPDKPNSRLQKYRLTAQGRSWLAQHPPSAS